MSDLVLPDRKDVLRHGGRLPRIAGGSPDFRLFDGMDYELVGMNEATSTGTAVASSSTVNVKGSWVQLVAATLRPSTGVAVFLTGGSGFNFLVDIAVGAAGSEVVVLPNLHLAALTSYPVAVYPFPLAIPAGVRVSARAQASLASQSVQVGCLLIEEGLAAVPAFTRVTAYGANTAASSLTAATTGTTNTKGAWTQLVAATTSQCSAVMLAFGSSPSGSSMSGLVDFGMGAAGNEIVFAGDLLMWDDGTYGSVSTLLLPKAIPAGTRLALRGQASSPGGLPKAAVYGLE